MLRQMSQPESPDSLARKAGKDFYGCAVGSLRRSELWRLGNAWGAKFPVGCTKDYMLPFFKQLEAEGKDPFKPPMAVPLRAIPSAESHAELGIDVVISQSAEVMQKEPDVLAPEVIQPKPKSEFESKLESLRHCDLKKICRERGIEQTNKDRKADLIARIVAASEAVSEQNISDGS